MSAPSLDYTAHAVAVRCQICTARGPTVSLSDYPRPTLAEHDADAEARRAGWLVETGDGECRVLCPACRGES